MKYMQTTAPGVIGCCKRLSISTPNQFLYLSLSLYAVFVHHLLIASNRAGAFHLSGSSLINQSRRPLLNKTERGFLSLTVFARSVA